MANKLRQLSLLSCLLFTFFSEFAEEITGHVVGVVDGDTLTLLVNGHDQINVRLAEIDAPEKSQPFEQRSK